MRLSRPDLVPGLTIIAGGAVGASLTFTALVLWSPSYDVFHPDPVVAISATAESAILRPVIRRLERHALKAELAAARTRWQESGVSDYTIELHRVGPWAAPCVRVEVRNDKASSVEQVDCSEPTYSMAVISEHYENPESWPTVSELFDIVESGIDDAYQVEVRFHRKLGYPTRFFMDWEKNWVDEEGGYIVRALEPRLARLSRGPRLVGHARGK